MPDPLDPIYNSAAQNWNVDPNLLRSVAQQESGGAQNPDQAVSPAGAIGRMQIMPKTAQELGVTDPTDPHQAIYGAAKYLSQLLDKYKSPSLALAAYNAGPDRVDAFMSGQQSLPQETQNYVPGVTKKYQGLTQQNQQQPQDDDPFAQALKAVGGTKPSAALVSSTSAVPQTKAPVELDPFEQALQAAKAPAQAPSAPASSAQPPANAATPDAAPADQSMLGSIGAGLGRAAHDLTDVPAEYLAKGADAVGLTGLMNKMGVGAPTGPQTTAADTNALQSYNQSYGNNPLATASRIGGQIAGTIPMLSAGGALAGGALDAAGLGGLGNVLAGSAGTGVLGRAGSMAANGALQGVGSGLLTAGQTSDRNLSDVLPDAAIGAIAGPTAGALGSTLGAVTGGAARTSPELAQLAKTARETYGIPVTAPQMTDNSLVRIANDQSSKLPFSGAGANQAAQQQAWQKAVIGQMGENATSATPEVMSAAAKRIGGVFNDVANRTNISVDGPLMDRLGQIESDVSTAPLGSGGDKAIKAQIDNIMNTAASGDGTIPGEAYQSLTRAGAPLQRAEHAGDPNVRFYASQIRDALDGAFQRSAAPEDQAALQQARYQWRSMKTIEDMAEKSPTGDLSPAQLLQQVRSASSKFDSSTGGMAYTGGGPLGDLAKIGQAFLKPPQNSGTADRLLTNSLLGGGAVAGAIANPLAGIAAPVAGLAANRALGGYLRSSGFANRVINNTLNPNTLSRTGQLLPPAAVGAYNRNNVPTVTIPNPLQQSQ